MAVPAEIRAVPRPVNTIVDDSGKDSLKRYAVRQRSSSKYVPGGNPQPRNGKVIGHIIGNQYVPLQEATAAEGPDMLSYGASALVKWCKKNYPCQKCADHKIQALDVFWAYFINGASSSSDVLSNNKILS